jgi:hypothetical protein
VSQRGFTPERIARVLRAGTPEKGMGRYGPQTRYTLGENTVVIANTGANAGKIVTVYSSDVANDGVWVE